MSAAKMIAAALLLPALIIAGVTAAVVWICRQRGNTSQSQASSRGLRAYV
jgi:hypothetical protein